MTTTWRTILAKAKAWLFGTSALTPAPARSRPERETASSFLFKDQVLDKLPDYFKILKRMKLGDPEAFELYSQVGAYLMPGESAVWAMSGLSEWWKLTRPAFGAVAIAIGPIDKKDDKKDHLYPRFVYFQKYDATKAPPDFQRVAPGADVYAVTVYWDDEDARVPTVFPIALMADGSVIVLRKRFVDEVVIRGTTGKGRGKKFSIPHTRWGLDKFFLDWAKSHNEKPETYLGGIFSGVASSFEAAQGSMFRISVVKSDMVATFGIDPRRGAYFFKDRLHVTGPKGGKKRIFHIVRPHDRVGTKGVKMHFRGMQDFTWHGYQVHISVPGLHHSLVAEFNSGAVDRDNLNEDHRRKYLTTRTFAGRMREAIFR